MWGGEEEEDDDEEEEDNYKTVNDHIIFLIDARPEMFAVNKNNEVIVVQEINNPNAIHI